MDSTKSAAKKVPRKPRRAEEREARRRAFYRDIDAGELSLREAVKQFRKLLGMNQREFAKHVGVSPRIIMAFEQGSGNPTLATVEKMLKGSGLELKPARKRRQKPLL